MTIKQKQCLLAYLGTLAPEDIDGLWGGVSAAATAKMQKILGLPEDGVWGPQTDAAIREHIVHRRLVGQHPLLDPGGIPLPLRRIPCPLLQRFPGGAGQDTGGAGG